MITKIISAADIHFPSYREIANLELSLENFYDDCRNIVNEEGVENVRIVIAGDIFHNKLAITNESMIAVNKFFRELGSICQTYIVAGNHDMNMANMDRVDSITPVFEIGGEIPNVIYLDRELNYKSGCYIDDNVVFCLYSSFDDFRVPSIKEEKIKHPDKTFVGIIHAEINKAVSPTNYESSNGLDSSIFEGCDFVIAGHIHKYQSIKYDGGEAVYCSSITQKNFGETVSGHGFVLWDIPSKTHEFHEVENAVGYFYKIAVSGITDLMEGREILLNK